MNFFEILEQSLQALRRNRLRSGLTMLGIVWGIVTVVLLLSYGHSLGTEIMAGMQGIGNNVITAYGGQTSMQAGGERAGHKVHLKDGDVEAVRASLPFLRDVSGETDSDFSFHYGAKVVNISSKAVDLPYAEMRKLVIDQGRLFDESDFADHRHVVIFGPHAAQKLFNGYPPVGETVEIDGKVFDVIGVLRTKIQESANNGPDNENAFFPFPLMRELRQERDPSSIVFEPSTAAEHLHAIEGVRTVLAQRHHFDPADEKALSVWDTVEESASLRQFSVGLQVLLGIIGAMTLAVGGVGVMNIMLVSVTERTREIGLMKALGARPRDIRRQFLLESLTLTLLAGMVGMVVAVVVAYLIPAMPLYSDIYKTANHEGDIVLRVSPVILLTAALILGVIGVVSGMIPAMRAARLDPVVALRRD